YVYGIMHLYKTNTEIKKLFLLNAINFDIDAFLNSIWTWITTEGLKVIIGAVILFIVCKLTNLIIKKIDKRLCKKSVDTTLRVVLLPWLGRIIKILALCAYIGYLGFETSGISAAIASIGVTIGLALQGSLSNLAGGIVILVTRPFRIGDKVTIDGETGVVENITIMYTYIVTADNLVICLPNSQVTSNKLTNFNKKQNLRQELQFTIAYGNDYKEAKQLCLKCAGEDERVLTDPEATCRLVEHGAHGLILSLKVWTTFEDYWGVHNDLMEKITDALMENNFEIPYNQLDVHIDNKN
ncbi:MAG: mechanosensitive ion channel family protein, partial [Clostridia bacterium]|nr:mechanosensitive ion channel family protein [Clostridia bacterium]